MLRRRAIRLLLLAAVAVVVRAPALHGDRIWDDHFLAYENPFIKSPLLILEVFRHYLFPDSFSAHYRPVQNISLMFDYLLWGTNTFGYHLTNVLLHAVGGVLLYLLLLQILPSLLLRRVAADGDTAFGDRNHWTDSAAFVVALIWVVHPVHSAAVDYISGRADSLAFVFSAAGWLLYLAARGSNTNRKRVLVYLLSALCGVLALLSRETACIWIAVFLIHQLAVERTGTRRSRMATLGCSITILALYLALRHLPEQRPPSPLDLRHMPEVRAVLMARALGDYARLLVLPTNLHMERSVLSDPRSLASTTGWERSVSTEYLSMLGLGFFLLLLITATRKGIAQPMRVFGASWFLIGYLPVSNIVQLNATVAEHWLYLPAVGFLIWLLSWAYELPRSYGRILPRLAVVAVIALGARSFIRSGDWTDEETFYKRTFAAGSSSARVTLNLGQLYSKRGSYAEAERMFRLVLEQNPTYPSALNNLAAALYREGKIKDAERLFAEVEKNSVETRKAYPRTWFGALNLAKMRFNAKDTETALALLEKARHDNPHVWDLISFECEILRQTGKIDGALRLAENFAAAHWWHEGAAIAVGQLYAQTGDVDRATKSLRRASWLDLHDAKPLNLLASIQLRENHLADACTIQRRAIARQPDEPRQYILLSNILEKMGRDDEARAALARVSQMRELAQSEQALVN